MPSSTYRRRFDYRAVRNRRTYRIAAQTSVAVAVEAVVTASPVRRPRSSGNINLTNPVNWQHPLNKGLVAWWIGLPGRTGNVLYNLVGRNHGTLTNGPTWRAGPNGFAANNFDGTDDYVSPPNLGLSGAIARTFAGWIYQTSISSGTKSIFRCGPDNTSALQTFGLWCNVTINGDLYVPFWSRDWYTGAVITANTWTHVTVTYNGGAVQTAGNVVVYVNGVSRSLTSVGSATGNANTVETAYRLGADPISGLYLSGSLSDLRFHNRALAADEVFALYDQSRRGHPNTLRRVGRGSVSVASISAPGSASILPIVQHHRLMQGIR